jgi:hypothetical protein
MAPTLCAASLIPLNKKDGGIRPIAVGETLRRLIGKVLLATPSVKAAAQTLVPRQTGVGVPKAAEMIGMGVQRFVDSTSNSADWIIAQVDVANAYNTLTREAVLRGAAAKAPGSFNWLRFCYTQHVPLYCQGKRLCGSETGVHQGDACGPLAFALGLEVALDECATEEHALAWGVWYLDDGTIVGEAPDVYAYLDVLEVALAKVGLVLNPTKCRLWGPGVQDRTDPGPHFPDEMPEAHVARRIPVTPFSPGEGLTTLGVPADAPGGAAHSIKKWHTAVDQAMELLAALQRFLESQIRHTLLRFCLDGCRVMHLLRSTGGAKAMAEISRLSAAIRATTESIVGGTTRTTNMPRLRCPLRAVAWE